MCRGTVLAILFVLVAAACGGSAASTNTISTTIGPTPATASPTTSRPAPASTTTAAVATTPATTVPTISPGDIPDGIVGFVGCSVSQNAVAGYSRILGGTRLWPANAPYGGGSLGRWARDLESDRSRYWTGFDEGLAENPDTTVIWFSLCTIRGAPGDSVDIAESIAGEVRKRLPGAVLYVSAQPDYAGGHVCELAGETGPQQMADIAAQLVDMGVALPGPLMGPLTEAQTADGCHANDAGQELMGRQLMDFFG
ncbi:MAG: hypothetical protein OEM97_00135 [Acidimicrobiia bacterium]|nr:hypothetical protein [Acidimicrobiia bacterium]